MALPDPRRALFVVLDGIDGCGKSTQAARLATALGAERDVPPLHLREPGSTRLGEELRALLLDGDAALDPGTEALLFAAARREMLRQLVVPALEAGRDVVCERFHASTYAYQGVAGGVDEELLLALLGEWSGAPRPDVVLLLDLPLENAHARALERGREDRFERRGREFQERVAEGYRRYAERTPRVSVVDARGSEDEVAERVRAEVERVRG